MPRQSGVRTSSRKKHVQASYGSPESAASYARSYAGTRPESHFFRLRLQLVQDLLACCPGGNLLDAGCGPGILDKVLLESRPNDFHITVLDQSRAMVEYCRKNVGDMGEVRPTVAQLELMPFADQSFDVTLVLGALEYTDAKPAIAEISRISRLGSLVIVSMLNPLSPYRFVDLFLYQPSVRVIKRIKRLFVPDERGYEVQATGIRALPARRLQRMMRQMSLQPIDLIYFDVTPLIPPLDRILRDARKLQTAGSDSQVTRGWRRFMGTAYLIVARHSG